MLLALNVSSSPPATAIFRPRCTENNRGIGDVSATSSHNSVALWWEAPGYAFQSIHVCYKKNWGLRDKCDRYQNETYGSPVSWGQIIISGLESNSCYKFAVYGGELNHLIGQKKIRTTR
jgi:hypothetical protein